MLLVDNYDSFTFNLAHLFGELGVEVVVRRNDELDADEAEGLGSLAPRRLTRSRADPMPPVQRRRSSPASHGRLPTLGVCLGHQAIVEAFGGEIGAARELVHGKATTVQHDGEGIFRGLPEGFEAGRYHSLAATRIPDELEICATAPDGEIMAVRHRTLPVHGVQFHPESVLTPVGPDLARNFLEAA